MAFHKVCTILHHTKIPNIAMLKLPPIASTLTTSPSNIGQHAQKHARLGPGKHSREALRLPREGVVSMLREYSATVGDRYGEWV